MDIRDQLLQELSRFNMHFIADFCGDSPRKFEMLVRLYIDEKDPVPARAAWVMEIISNSYPELLQPYIGEIISHLSEFTHPGSRRNGLKMLTRSRIPEDYQGSLIDTCFEWIMDGDKTVAVKVFAMQIIENHLSLYPELAYELKGIIEDQWDKNSAGFKSRGRKVLRNLEKYLD